MTTEKTIKYSMCALPLLINYAQRRRILTYGKLGDQIGCHHRYTAHILGYIRDEVCIPRKFPYLNAIVVRKDTLLPGDAWLPGGTDYLSEEGYRKQYEQFRDEVFGFSHWNGLLKELSLVPVHFSEIDLKESGRTFSLLFRQKAVGGEGKAHRELKEFIAGHPEEIGLYSFKKVEMEHMFISGDCCDILFSSSNRKYAIVEIKNGNPGELVRGIYQLIKYKALLIAEEELTLTEVPQLYLVAYEICPEVKNLASKFEIKCKQIRKADGIKPFKVFATNHIQRKLYQGKSDE